MIKFIRQMFKREPSFDLPAYLECAECHAHSVVDGNGGQIRCPHCRSTRLARLDAGTMGRPSWFKKGHP